MLSEFLTMPRGSTAYENSGLDSAQVVLVNFKVFTDPVLTVSETEDYYLAISAAGAIAVLVKQNMLEQ